MYKNASEASFAHRHRHPILTCTNSGLGLDAGWLVIFDRRTGQPPIRERTSSEEQPRPQGRRIAVIRA
jgi:hypothetical protein